MFAINAARKNSAEQRVVVTGLGTVNAIAGDRKSVV